jgi:transcriptional regulator with XRE-family HTH domain
VTDVSGVLRAARERAGLTIEEISAATKIKVPLLRAIERGEFEQLPGEFFTRAFLRTYARELHLAPDEVVAVYDATRVHSTTVATLPASTTVDHQTPGAAHLHSRSFSLPSPRSAWPKVALAAAVLAVVWALNRPAPATSEGPRPVATTGVEGAARPAQSKPPAVSPKLSIEIRPTRVMWVAGLADGKRVVYRLLEAGEVVKIEAAGDLWFRMGDAGAFEYSLNGVPGKALGAPGEVREVRITHANLDAFRR